MVVTEFNFNRIIKSFAERTYLVIDCETTGLDWFKEHKLFSFAISTHNVQYYFSFHPKHPDCLSRSVIKYVLKYFKGTVIGHNLKFDAFFFLKEGLDLRKWAWYDTMVAQRVIRNDEKSLSLDALTGQKDNIKEYCKTHRHYTVWKSPYAKKSKKIYHYDRVPYYLIKPYCCNDVKITRDLMLKQLRQANKNDMKVIRKEREVEK